MKYLITDQLKEVKIRDLRDKGLYVYNLKEGKKIVKTIITDRRINKDKFSYKDFYKNNKEVCFIEDLLISKKYLIELKLDTSVNVHREFDFLFSESDEYLKLDRMTAKQKKDYIIDYYELSRDYDLVSTDNKIYKLYRIDYSRG